MSRIWFRIWDIEISFSLQFGTCDKNQNTDSSGANLWKSELREYLILDTIY